MEYSSTVHLQNKDEEDSTELTAVSEPLIKAEDVAAYLGISKDSLRAIHPYLPFVGQTKNDTLSYTTTTAFLEHFQTRLKEITNGDFNSIKEVVQASKMELLNNPAFYKKASSECITIAFNNLKGGVSKTTTTANLGAILVALNQRVLLIDMDMQNQLSTYFSKDIDFDVNDDIEGMEDEDIRYLCDTISKEKYAGNSILNIIKEYAETKEMNYALVDKMIQTFDIGLGKDKTIDVLPSEWKLGRGLETARSISSVSILLKKLLKKVKERYDFILIDTSPANMLSIELSFFASDYITLVSTPDKKSFQSFMNILEELDLFKDDMEDYNVNIRLDSIILSKMLDKKTPKSQKIFKKLYSFVAADRDLQIYSTPQREYFAAADLKRLPLIAMQENKIEALTTISGLCEYALNLINRRG